MSSFLGQGFWENYKRDNFQNRNFKSFVTESYIDAINNDGLAPVHGERRRGTFKNLEGLPLNVDYKGNSNVLVFSPVCLTHPR